MEYWNDSLAKQTAFYNAYMWFITKKPLQSLESCIEYQLYPSYLKKRIFESEIYYLIITQMS